MGFRDFRVEALGLLQFHFFGIWGSRVSVFGLRVLGDSSVSVFRV